MPEMGSDWVASVTETMSGHVADAKMPPAARITRETFQSSDPGGACGWRTAHDMMQPWKVRCPCVETVFWRTYRSKASCLTRPVRDMTLRAADTFAALVYVAVMTLMSTECDRRTG
jgi:hypothetical protein